MLLSLANGRFFDAHIIHAPPREHGQAGNTLHSLIMRGLVADPWQAREAARALAGPEAASEIEWDPILNAPELTDVGRVIARELRKETMA